MDRVPPARSLVLGLAISIGFLVLLVNQVDVRKSWNVLAGIDFRLMLLSALITFATLGLRPRRWQSIFPNSNRPTFWSSFRVFSIGTVANNVFPARAGDILRCFLISRERTLSGASLALATVGLEKVLDGMAALLVVLAAVFFVHSTELLTGMSLVSSCLFGGAIVMFIFLRFRSKRLIALIRSLFQRLHLPALGEKAALLLACFSDGLDVVGSPFRLASAAALTGLIWVGEGALVLTLGLSLSIALSFPAAMLVTAVIGLGLVLPAAPGAFGTYEFFAVTGLSLVGIKSEAALALALLIHAWIFITTSILGLISFGLGNAALFSGNSCYSVLSREREITTRETTPQ